MNRLQHHYPQLLLILVLLLATQTFSISGSNITQSLRPFQAERMLASAENISCKTGKCEETSKLTDDDVTYNIAMANQTTLNLTIVPFNENDLEVSIVWGSMRNLQLDLIYNSPQTKSLIVQQLFPAQKITDSAVPGPIETLTIRLYNKGSQNTTVIVNFDSVSDDSSTVSSWINPTAGAAGALLAITLISMWCHRRRLNRQRRYALRRRQIYQPVQIGSEPSSPRLAGNPEQEPQQEQEQQQQLQLLQQRQQQQQAVPKPSIEEIIDTRFAEAKFNKFKSSFPQKTCTICLEDMQEEQPCRQLDCQHIFHSQCGKLWLQNQFQKMKKAFCPNCNQQVNFKPKRVAKPKKREGQ